MHGKARCERERERERSGCKRASCESRGDSKNRRAGVFQSLLAFPFGFSPFLCPAKATLFRSALSVLPAETLLLSSSRPTEPAIRRRGLNARPRSRRVRMRQRDPFYCFRQNQARGGTKRRRKGIGNLLVNFHRWIDPSIRTISPPTATRAANL